MHPREQEVVGLVTAGLMNKQVAAELGVSEITVKVHRGNVMKKMGARSLLIWCGWPMQSEFGKQSLILSSLPSEYR